VGNKVLVAGVSGVVGYATAQQFALDPTCEVIGVSRRAPGRLGRVRHLALDLADAGATAAAAAGLEDVTHLVYAALFEKPGLIPGWYEQDQMQTNLTMFRNLLDSLTATARNLQHVTLLQGTKAYGAHVAPMTVPGREREPRHPHENFYWLQEDHLRGRQAADGQRWAWSIMRPQIIFGEALGSNMNAIPALGVYAALLREAGEPLHWPGGVALVSEAVDADLLGRAIVWAATTPACRDETFNVTNGDVFCLRHLWPAIADAFGMEVGEDRPYSLAANVPARVAEWTDIVRRYGLSAPSDLDAFVGQSFIYADVIMGFGMEHAPSPALVSTIKIRQAGFTECIDTEDMFRRWIAHFQSLALFPPRRS
jgi:nucleoside-diphosphate-sugar epimerase